MGNGTPSCAAPTPCCQQPCSETIAPNLDLDLVYAGGVALESCDTPSSWRCPGTGTTPRSQPEMPRSSRFKTRVQTTSLGSQRRSCSHTAQQVHPTPIAHNANSEGPAAQFGLPFEQALDAGQAGLGGRLLLPASATEAVKPASQPETGDGDGTACAGDAAAGDRSALVKTHGKYTYDDGAVYEGQWAQGVRDGHGRHVEADGCTYDGQWRHDTAYGEGTLVHVDGDTYIGQWLSNSKHGRGTYVHRDGAEYVGEWVDDMQSGDGKETWRDGCTFTGQYHLGSKSGNGLYTWPNGSSYDGQFVDNEIHGHGAYTWGDGCVYNGLWARQQMHGHGKLRYPDGKEYDGEFRTDLKDGQGTFIWSNGRSYTGQWRDGKQHGAGEWTQDGSVRKGTWVHGILSSWEGDRSMPQLGLLPEQPPGKELGGSQAEVEPRDQGAGG